MLLKSFWYFFNKQRRLFSLCSMRLRKTEGAVCTKEKLKAPYAKKKAIFYAPSYPMRSLMPLLFYAPEFSYAPEKGAYCPFP